MFKAGKFSIEIECGECQETSAEYIQSSEYPFGAIVIISRHHGRKHKTVIDMQQIPRLPVGIEGATTSDV